MWRVQVRPCFSGLSRQLAHGAYSGSAAAAAARRDAVLVAAQSALGAAMRALGPEVVLEALPLNLIEASSLF